MATILIADDMPVIREPIAFALERAGYTALCASTGVEALATLRHRSCDLLLLDIHMPEMNGIETLRCIRADAMLRDLPVILLTDVSDRDIIVQAAGMGVRHYLLKSSFAVDELLKRVNALVPGSAQAGAPATSAADTARAGAGDTGTAPASTPAGAGTTGAGTVEPGTVTQPAASPAGSVTPPAEPPESPDDALKERKPILKRSELAELLETCGELKAMSPTVAEVVKLSNNPRASIERIGKAIRRDHAIALKTLRLANSSAYASGEPVDSVDKAVIRIGFKAIGQAVLNIAVVDQFKSGPEATSRIDPRLFWEHSIGCGIIAARLANAIGCTEPDTAFTMGLIHDVGRLVYADLLGEQYETVLDTAEELQLPLEQVEKRLLLLSHADGMDRILHQWRFPRDLIDPIVFHHLSMGNIRRTAPKRRDEVATVALANRLAHALMLGASGNETIYSTHEFCDALRLQPRLISEIESEARDETDELKFAMLAGSATDAWPDTQADARERLGAPFRPIFVGAHPDFDAYRIFCDLLTDRSEESPNIGIIHLVDARDRAPLSNTFREAESQAEVDHLPLLLLSPAGRLKPEAGLLADREYECLPTPVAVVRLLAAFRRLLDAHAPAEIA